MCSPEEWDTPMMLFPMRARVFLFGETGLIHTPELPIHQLGKKKKNHSCKAEAICVFLTLHVQHELGRYGLKVISQYF